MPGSLPLHMERMYWYGQGPQSLQGFEPPVKYEIPSTHWEEEASSVRATATDATCGTSPASDLPSAIGYSPAICIFRLFWKNPVEIRPLKVTSSLRWSDLQKHVQCRRVFPARPFSNSSASLSSLQLCSCALDGVLLLWVMCILYVPCSFAYTPKQPLSIKTERPTSVVDPRLGSIRAPCPPPFTLHRVSRASTQPMCGHGVQLSSSTKFGSFNALESPNLNASAAFSEHAAAAAAINTPYFMFATHGSSTRQVSLRTTTFAKNRTQSE